MIIGVDIDDTLTDIRDKIKEEATKYANIKRLEKAVKEAEDGKLTVHELIEVEDE